MIDLHNHILPAVDDGARDVEEALTMARQAVDAGTHVLAATPHRFWHKRDISAEDVAGHVQRLQHELIRQKIPLKIVAGCEIPMWGDPIIGLMDGTLMRLGGPKSSSALIEPPFDSLPENALSLLKDVQRLGLLPVLAHPERNRDVQKDLAFVEACAQMGVVLQITSGSILGHFGRAPQFSAHAIAMHTDWKVIIASDSHWSHDRTPAHLGLARDKVAEWIGDAERALQMVEDLPASLIAGGE